MELVPQKYFNFDFVCIGIKSHGKLKLALLDEIFFFLFLKVKVMKCRVCLRENEMLGIAGQLTFFLGVSVH